MKRFGGVFAPIVTPFRHDDTLDETGLRGNLARWITTPLTGLVVLGSNGEAPLLDDAEADRVIAIAREAVPRTKVLIAGVGREATKATIAAAKRAAATGVDAVIVRTPSFFKPQMTTDVFVRHYAEVADASPVPIFLYNVTLFTGVNLLPAAVERLVSHPNIAGMKESGGDIAQIAEYCAIAGRLPSTSLGPGKAAPTSKDFVVLAGSATTLVHAFAAGCDGAIVALAGLCPAEVVRLFALVRDNKLDEARALQRELMPLARSVGGGFGVPGLKAALDLMGFAGGPPRLPLPPASAETIEVIRQQLVGRGLSGSPGEPDRVRPTYVHD